MLFKATTFASSLLVLSTGASAAAVKARQNLIPSVNLNPIIVTPNVSITNGTLAVGPTNITLLNATVPGFELKKRSPLTITIPLNNIPITVPGSGIALNLPNITINLGGDNTGIVIGSGGIFTPILNLTIGGQPIGPTPSAVNASLGLGGSDTCVYTIDGTFDSVSDLLTGGTNAYVFNDVCLCESTVPGFILSSEQALAIAADQGLANVTALLDVLVSTDPASELCTFPPHSTPGCIFNNPCSFICLPGYQKIGDVCARSDTDPTFCTNGFSMDTAGTCTCDAPNMVYDGTCQTAAAATRRRSSWF